MTYTSIDQIFNDFNNLKVLIIGDVMVDAYIWGAIDRISPEAPVPVVRATKRDYRLGGAANVALNIDALGAKPILCAIIGEDDTADKLKGRLVERGMATEGLVSSAGRPTTVKTRIISGHQHVVRVDEEVDKEISGADEKQLMARIDELLPKVDVVVFEDYDKGVITKKIIKHTVELGQKHNIPTVVDPKKRHFLSYKGVTVFKPNLKELKEGLKLDFDKQDQPAIEKAVDTLIDKIECDGALITLSERGVYVKYNGEAHLIPAHMREISDVSGAGDTVISLVALAVALKLSPYMVAALSNLGGGLVCEHVGVVPIDKEELKKEAEKQNWL
ncbi:D-glycero-beta-D-manno-heptose-7-phosphate kinase [Fulvivirga sp. RKSG066]|uniref:bifunctional heptose 7-phosphate kinase/heptose 1-phosphate adenyltransferase n=1 Tax=Fulvivirga aurantia TaxID=2529383 RepID=UPI0012BC72A7|nr:PfkB family carbohydrate kinase [Fulvivirga aurantia]MTI23182.1 D-glycero-beta-D-manno-heptose-7-phosphate kinase [Fulvivirga aurantia]